jgi:hypothetical protein
MNPNQKKLWREKNKLDNANVTLTIGTEVKDVNGNMGVVVKIVPPSNDDNHGTVYVWQSELTEYGSDNCEHYTYINWKEHLRVLKSSVINETHSNQR